MSYREKLAKKNEIKYIKVERIYLGDNKTYLESSGDGQWQIVSPNSIFRIQDDGSIYISGNVKIDSKLEVNDNLTCNKKITTKELEDKSVVTK